ncbi:hypothetical protein LOY18_12000 [Staphylococcus capitis]|uniref:TOTE conflict system archaeo-eukaryotic primase domain-containing protein n=1 Tax=Staphylococcus capitis TaxID=29388 RepID=UPI001E4BF8BC|nr:hypothetical protein [Staphylococcus capitis]MCC9117504.1 hypothetical protein [Staphylococcus capitis]MCC9143959.1 hypothetical protein [Staphylococcus capitis]
MTQVTDLRLVQALEKLFISSKQARIEQQADGSYYTKRNGLAREHLLNHIVGTQTVGIFSGKTFSKYICFDVDTGKESIAQARNDVRVLRSVLCNDFNIPYDYIPVAYSGNKGYHVYLFFDNVICVDYLHAFYREVLDRAGYSTSEIEFRPTAKLGVKLPLGIHRVTGKRCNFVDPTTPRFKQKDKEFIYEIKQLNAKSFEDTHKLKDLYDIKLEETYHQLYRFLYDDEALIFNSVLRTLDFTEYQIEHAQQDIINMLQNKRLIYPDTRNKYTLLLATFLKAQGHEIPYTEKVINEIMLNSKRNYRGLVQSSESHIKQETQKIVKYVFNHNITLSSNNKEVALYGDEIRDILALKDMKLMKLYTSMLVHAKRHTPLGADSFYMPYSTMQNYGNTSQRNTLRRYIGKLEELGRVKVVKRGVVDEVRTHVEGHVVHKANVYSIKKSFNQNPDEKVLIKADGTNVNINDILIKAYQNDVISYKHIKDNLTRRQFEKFKQAL